MKITILLMISFLSGSVTQAFEDKDPQMRGFLSNTHQHLVYQFIRNTLDPEWLEAGIVANNRVPGHSASYFEFDVVPQIYERVSVRQHELELKLSKSVFVATTGTGTAQGTAFLIAKDLVLTNKHVLASSSECGKFSIQLNHRNESITCQKVLYCDPKEDFCIIQMNSLQDGRLLGEEVEPLVLSRKIPTKNSMTMILGNAMGLGMQAASYQGAKIDGNYLLHCNRALSGNSGSPIFDDQGEVLGIHFGRSGMEPDFCPSDRNVGLAVKSDKILKTLKGLAVQGF